jgi:hypothetical protein
MSIAGLEPPAQSDTEAARDMQQAKRQLWAGIRKRSG